ncbi:MAG: preprotein translocase subunit YajC [Gemmatimonadaceae bacterium]|nr:preprotein translocase subunit YajC [Gemmatimonadaceae bacterium]
MPVLPLFLFQAPPAAPQGGGGGLVFFVQIAVIIAIFYFIVLRPQRKQQKQLEASLRAMSKGDEVVTAGGLVGEIVRIKEGVQDGKPVAGMSDRITIRTGQAEVIVERGRIVRVSKPAAAG